MACSRLRAALALPFALLLSACPGKSPPKAPSPPTPPKVAGVSERVEWRSSKSGLGFRLSDADPEPPPRPKLARSKPLTPDATKKLLAKLPPFKAPAEEKKLALRDKSRPAPRPGQTLTTPFPPPVRAPSPPPNLTPGAAPSVVRWAPEGAIDIAPNLSLTFSEPMVPVTSNDELAATNVPVRLSPQPPGRFRWVGTQTLLFEPTLEEFPKATDYKVEVPAGTRTANGRTIEHATSFMFKLPPPRVEEFLPQTYEPLELDALFFIRFDQRIDAPAVLRHIVLATTPKTRPIALRLATADEIEAKENIRRAVEQAEPNRYLAFRAVDPLPKATKFAIEVPPGLPSAEGPKTTEKAVSFQAHTFGPMKMSSVHCGWYEGCPPLAAWSVQFSNPIETGAFDKSVVRVEPSLPGMRISVAANVIVIQGRSKGRTRYTVRIAAGVPDKFGQKLEAPAEGTIDVDPAEPMLFPEEREMVVLDPAFEPALSVYSVNQPSLRVQLYAVEPRDWERYARYREGWDADGKLVQPPGKPVVTRVVKPRHAPDELVETPIDLRPALHDGFGQLIAVVEPPVQKREKYERQWVRSWVQVTKLGLQTYSDPTHLYGWVSKLADGVPVAGAEVGLVTRSNLKNLLVAVSPGTTGADGIASVALGKAGAIAYAKQGSDFVFLPTGSDEVFAARPEADSLHWFTFDDRNLYKPGERVSVKGWLRISTAGKKGDIAGIPCGANTISYIVSDPRASKLTDGSVEVGPDGGFNLSFDLPKNVNLGAAIISFAAKSGPITRFAGINYVHHFEIEEFRRPEFEVKAETTEGPHFVGKHAIATVTATYYAGGALPDSEVKWRVQADDAFFSPPNRRGFHFGKPQRFSWGHKDDKKRHADETWTSRTHGGGKHRLRIDFDALEPSYPRKLDLEASITDVNRQTWTARTGLVVHPATVTVGLRPESTLPTAGQNLQVDVVVTGIDGKSVPGRATKVACARVETTWRGDEAVETLRDAKDCALTSDGSPETPQRCSFATKEGGRHRLTADVSDEHGRTSHTELDVWVLGGDYPMEAGIRQGTVDIITDKTEYAAGDQARLLVMAPFAPAEGVLTLERGGVVELKRFKLARRADTLSVRLDPSWVPGVQARVHVVGSAVRENESGDPDPSLPKRPAYAQGVVNLEIPPRDRALKITVTPRPKALDPGGTTHIALDVADAAGRPVAQSSLALVVVDESVLALAGYELPDPLKIFYAARNPDVTTFETHDRVVLGKPDLSRMRLQPNKPGKKDGGGAGGFGSGHGRLSTETSGSAAPNMRTARAVASAAPAELQMMPNAKGERRADKTEKKPEAEANIDHDGIADEQEKIEFKVRSDFNALAAFLPKLSSDGHGHVEAAVKLPESLTRYRVIAVGSAGDKQFGVAESDVTARLPLMVRPSAPRFLNYGDKADLPVVLQNQTAEPMDVDVALRVANLRLVDPNGQHVIVPAADRVELRFPLAANEAGTARFQVGAIGRTVKSSSNTGRIVTDAAEIELPVWTPATTEAFATYGVVDQGAIAQPVQVPRGVVTAFGGVEITTSSTALQGLTDAILYIVRYPFDCNEQIASRVMTIAAMRDVLGAFEAEGLPKPDALRRTIGLDIQKLAERQHWSGGWGFWGPNTQPNPFLTVHVMHAFARAKAKGYTLEPNSLARGLAYLRDIRSKFVPAQWWPPEVRWAIEAYSLDVRRRLGESDVTRTRALLREATVEKMPIEALGWLLPLLSKDPAAATELAAVRRHLDNRVTETAGKAHFVTSYGDNAHLLLHSDRRADAVLLESFIDDRPTSDVIPKLVAGLLAQRKAGHWYTTQENVFVLVALDRYFQTYEKATPDFVARAWLGDRFAGEHPFKGRSIDRQHIDIPLAALAEIAPAPQPTNVTLSKDGQGRLYFRIGMQYAPADLRPAPAEHGFSVTRVYEAISETTSSTTANASDVRRDADGTWRIRAGSLVRVRLTMVAPARRYHVALVDPLPAGLEPLNPALATTESIPLDSEDDPSSPAAQRGARGTSRAGGPRGHVPWWWSRAWYEHQNLRDERVEAFASLLWDGVYSYTYVARATTPGDFVVPPPKAEEMYDPETFGRGRGDRVVVY